MILPKSCPLDRCLIQLHELSLLIIAGYLINTAQTELRRSETSTQHRANFCFFRLYKKCGHYRKYTVFNRTLIFVNFDFKSLKIIGFYNGGGLRSGGPARGLGGRSPPEAEAKYEISVQFLTFSCMKFWI